MVSDSNCGLCCMPQAEDIAKKLFTSSIQHNSEDDFESPVPRFLQYDLQKRIRIRNSPLSLYTFIQSLNAKQKIAVNKIRFGSILELKITSLPTCLGYRLLANYDPTNCRINLGSHVVKITPQLVKEVLGIPMGSTKLKELGKPSIRDPIRDLVKTNGDAGRFFELNFLVIFYTVIGKMTQGSKVNTKFLTSLKDGAEIKSFDWCSYIVSCLNKTRIKWNGYQHYNGRLTFLLLVYAYDVYQRENHKKKKVTGISFNTNESLNELDAQLIDDQNIIKQK
ncbi:hypothetical protein R6Q57_008173 [Mikania cordata]